jgi:L-ribulose-5-phosphate 4-epimerase
MKNYFKLASACISQNKKLIQKKLVIYNFGNVSLRLDKDHFVIKPSGAKISNLVPNDIPIINIKSGKKIKGKLKPSTDTPTHLEIYKHNKDIKSITHTHSTYATVWAQSAKPIPLIGTTHADYWKNEVPVVKFISLKDLNKGYEKITGKLILQTLKNKKLDVYKCPGVIVAGHGPFTWGTKIDSSVIIAEILEFVAQTTFQSYLLKIKKKLPKHISKKHYVRKNGKKSYYGQK